MTGRRCCTCREIMPLAAFTLSRTTRDGFAPQCRMCKAAVQARWRASHSEDEATRNERRRVVPALLTCVECDATFEGRSDRLTCSRRCKDRRESLDQKRARYRRKNHLRRLRLRCGATLTAKDERGLREAAHACPLCGVVLTVTQGPRQKHLDHVVPISVGGSHELSNVRVICRTCNLARPKDGSDLDQLTLAVAA